MAEMVPVWEKANLTLEEAAAYFGIGINKLRDLTNEESWRNIWRLPIPYRW